jgi:hypothetical protein
MEDDLDKEILRLQGIRKTRTRLIDAAEMELRDGIPTIETSICRMALSHHDLKSGPGGEAVGFVVAAVAAFLEGKPLPSMDREPLIRRGQ